MKIAVMIILGLILIALINISFKLTNIQNSKNHEFIMINYIYDNIDKIYLGFRIIFKTRYNIDIEHEFAVYRKRLDDMIKDEENNSDD